jgi:DNA-binding NtrC family response regulator
MMSDHPPRILVIDCERHQIDTVCRGLHLHGYCCLGVQGVEEAMAEIEGVDLVLVDLTMPGGSGLDLIESVRKEWPDIPMVVITGLEGDLRESGLPTIQKPFDPDTLDATIRRALDPSARRSSRPAPR